MSGNSATTNSAYGGGIYNAATATVTNSTLSLNSSTSGGGIYNGGTLTLTNSTLLGNLCTYFGVTGGGIENGGTMTLTSDTLSGGSADGFLVVSSGMLTVKDTILANGPGNCYLTGSYISSGYNISDDTTCSGFLNNTGDLNNTPAGLDPNGLQNNGGPTQTIALLSISPAINAIPVGVGGFCTAADGVTPVSTDQRGVSRPQGTGCDIGAFELTHSTALLTIAKYQTTGLALGQQGATYTMVVSNAIAAGSTSGTVTVSDAIPSGLTLVSMAGAGWSCASSTCTRSDVLTAGASYPPITVTVNLAANAVSPLVNTATVSGGGSAPASASAPAILSGAPILSIANVISTGAGGFALGQQGATYALTVSNAAVAGPTNATVTVSDTLPSGLTLVSMTGTGWSCTNNTCSRSDVLAAGASYPPITVTVNVRANATSPQINMATVSGGGWTTASASVSTPITGIPVLNIAKSHIGNFTLGQQGAIYTVAVNDVAGSGPTSGTVFVSDTLPSGLTLVTIGGLGWSCAATTCSRSDVLAAGASYSPITVTVNVAAHASSPQINSATVSGGGAATVTTFDSTTISGAPVLSISKTHLGSAPAGGLVHYTLSVSNAAGSGPTSGTVTVTDTPPSGLTLGSMSGSAGTGWSCGGNTCSRSDVLAPGSSYDYISVAATVAANATSPQVNVATVSGGGSATASASDSTPIVPASLSIVKTHTGVFTQGQQGTYAVTVSNAGIGATGGAVTVTDNLPTGLTLVSMVGTGWSCASNACTRSDSLAAGGSYPPITVTVAVSSAAPSTVTNVASVSGGGSTGASANDPTNISVPTYAISGSVTVGGVGLSGVTVSLSGTLAGSTLTNGSGSYSFGGLVAGGTYTLAASLAGYSFGVPVTFSNLSANQVANFTGSAGLEFYSVTPCRIADTRTGAGFAGQFGPPTMAGGAARTFSILSSPCAAGIPTTASAYSLNFTAVPPAGGPEANLTTWPTGLATGMPNVSTLNYYSSVVANAAAVAAGTNGAINTYVVDPTDVLIDISGYFAPPLASGLEFYPVTPCRIADTRTGAGFTGQFGPPSMAGGATRTFGILSSPCAAGIPATASAYSLNFTAVPPAGGPESNLTTWPTGLAAGMPNVSTLNYYSSVVANAAVVPAGTNGAINAYVVDPTDLLIDIDGYFAPPLASGLHFYPLTPCRIADTRTGAGFTGQFGPPTMATGATRTFTLPASSCGVPATASAYSLNFTVVPPAGGPEANLTTWPTGLATGMPNVSTLNYYSSVVANAAIVPAGTNGAINVYVVDPTDVLIDVNGYFAP